QTRRRRLQWGRRVNTADAVVKRDRGPHREFASMGPPREHGGCARLVATRLKPDSRTASMGPPREHGGCYVVAVNRNAGTLLQWGRRVNTADASGAAAGPAAKALLQWGRSVNTADAAKHWANCLARLRFNGAAA